jgi:hypothetical protein
VGGSTPLELHTVYLSTTASMTSKKKKNRPKIRQGLPKKN